jgi:sugar phosphate isomerase/epimerase
MKSYFQKLAGLQEKYNILVMLENMPKDRTYSKLHDNSSDYILHHLETINDIVDSYGFLMTYDTSHAELVKPQETEIFEKLFPKIGNIHASSFVKGKHHIALGSGIFDAEGFVKYLKKKKYQGLFTLEVNNPTINLMKNTYDFSAIAQSVLLTKKSADK